MRGIRHFIVFLLLVQFNCTLSTAQNLVALEYSIDQYVKEGEGTLISLPGTSSELDEGFNLDISGLDHGAHVLYFRTLNSDSIWSFAAEQSFYLAPEHEEETIAGIEYSIDGYNDLGNGTSIPLSGKASTIDSSFVIDIDGLTPGSHTIHFRSINSKGIASLPVAAGFYLSQTDTSKISSIYYRLLEPDTQGNWQTAALSPLRNPVDSVIAVSLDSLIVGNEYALEVYATNEHGVRGFSSFRDFFTYRENHAPIANIESAQISMFTLETFTLVCDTLFTDEDSPFGDTLVFTYEEISPDDISGFGGFTLPGELTLTPGVLDAGEFIFRVHAEDIYGGIDSTLITLEVIKINHAPVALTTGLTLELSEEEFVEISLDTLFSDEDLVTGDKLAYSVLNNSASGGEFYSWPGEELVRFSPLAGDAGTYSYWLRATDTGQAADSINLNLVVNEVLGLSLAGNGQARVYPNPSKGIFQLQFTDLNEAEADVFIFSTGGELLQIFDYRPEIDLSDLPEGMYLLLVRTDEQLIRKKIVITR